MTKTLPSEAVSLSVVTHVFSLNTAIASPFFLPPSLLQYKFLPPPPPSTSPNFHFLLPPYQQFLLQHFTSNSYSFLNTMISSIKNTPSPCFASPDFLPKKRFLPTRLNFSPLPIIQNSTFYNSSFSADKPLHISSTDNLTFSPKQLKTQCNAYEADKSRPLDLNIEVLDEQVRLKASQKIKIGIYFAVWWALNVVFNIYNKKVLNAFPYPWLTSTLSLACGSLMMLISWATRIADAPKTDLDFWKTLFPVSFSFFDSMISRFQSFLAIFYFLPI